MKKSNIEIRFETLEGGSKAILTVKALDGSQLSVDEFLIAAEQAIMTVGQEGGLEEDNGDDSVKH